MAESTKVFSVVVSNLTNTFQMGWNHQLHCVILFWVVLFFFCSFSMHALCLLCHAPNMRKAGVSAMFGYLQSLIYIWSSLGEYGKVTTEKSVSSTAPFLGTEPFKPSSLPGFFSGRVLRSKLVSLVKQQQKWKVLKACYAQLSHIP